MSAGAAVEAGPVSPGAAVAARNAVATTRYTSVPAPAVVAADGIRCAHCGVQIPAPVDRRGLRRRFCRPAHREAARLRRERGLPEDHPIQPNLHGRRRLGAGREQAS